MPRLDSPILIGIGHRARSGKDTTADHLVENHGFRKTSWADLLKAGVNIWHGWDERHAYGDLKEVVDHNWGYSPRYAYQKIGTDLMRKQWRDTFWVDCAMLKIQGWMDAGISVVVPDCRFPNEVRAIKEAGGTVWKIERPSLPRLERKPKNPIVAYLKERWLRKVRHDFVGFAHESETALSDYQWDCVIHNTHGLDDLYSAADFAIQRLLRPPHTLDGLHIFAAQNR
jgi:hypothetical protein